MLYCEFLRHSKSVDPRALKEMARRHVDMTILRTELFAKLLSRSEIATISLQLLIAVASHGEARIPVSRCVVQRRPAWVFPGSQRPHEIISQLFIVRHKDNDMNAFASAVLAFVFPTPGKHIA